MMPGISVERFEAPVVEDQQIDPGEIPHARGDAPIAFGERELVDQPRQSGVEDRVVVAAGLVADRATLA